MNGAAWVLFPFPVPGGWQAIGPGGQREHIPAGADPWARLGELNATAQRWPYPDGD
jgi:hypothetical protein